MRLRLAILAVMAALPPAARADSIPVVSVARDGRTAGLAIPGEEYSRQLSQVLATVHESALSAIQGRAEEASRKEPPHRWLLRDVIVGVGLGFSAGLGPVYSVTAAPRVRLCYSNSSHPKFPD